jgi:hypothetical protein
MYLPLYFSLLKKNRKRRVESTKPSRERIRSRNGILT